MVADEGEEATALAREAVEREGRLRGEVRGELDAVDRLVFAVVDESGRGREGELAVGRDVVEGHAVLGVLASVERDVHTGAAAETSGLVVGLFAPRARENVVQNALIIGEVRIEEPVAREEVEHDGGELGGPAALGEKDGVRRGDVQLGPDA